LNVVGLFAGIGGIEEGLRRAGHDTRLLCESDPQAAEVLSERFPKVELDGDVATLHELPDDTDLLTAGFPCQDLSQAGRTNGIAGDRSSLVEHVFRLLESHDVPWVLIENVPFMLQLDRGAAMEYLVTRLEALDYRWAYRMIDSRSFGLPQRRRRVYFLASRTSDPAKPLLSEDRGPPPRPHHAGKACGFYWTEGNRGLGWAVDAIPPLKGGSSLGIPSPPAIWFPDGRIVTPHIRDAERLQGFEPDWTQPAERAGRSSARWRLVGNAVSVPAAAWIGKLLSDPEGTVLQAPRTDFTGSWPSAAYGFRGRRRAVNVSEWPVRSPAKPLDQFLEHSPKALSERATQGFLSRLTKSSLRYPVAFLRALEAHVEKSLDAAS
jgi:DNA (cytosine-5)-methyltransferase 1